MKKQKANEVICDILTVIMVSEMMRHGEHMYVCQSRLLSDLHIEQAVKWLAENNGCVSDAHTNWVNIYKAKLKESRLNRTTKASRY